MGWFSERWETLTSLVRRDQTAQTQEKLLKIAGLPPRDRLLQRPGAPPESVRPFFLPAPITDPQLLVGREQSFQNLEEALGQWLEGHPCSLALVGESGCGKTSLINCFLETIGTDFKVIRGRIKQRLESQEDVLDFLTHLFGIEEPVDGAPALVDRIQKLPPALIILDGGHNLLLRVIGGRRAAEAFFFVLLATRRQHFWLLTCRRWPWQNLSRHLNADQYFTHRMTLDEPNEEQQRTILEKRAEAAGLELFFGPPASTCEGEPSDKTEKNQDDVAESFYRDIFTASGGNLRAALYFWLLGSCFSNKNQVDLHPPGRLDTGFVRDLERDQLLTLSEIAGHGMLSMVEHQRVFRSDPLTSQLTYSLLHQFRLIEPAYAEDPISDTTPYTLDAVTQHAATDLLDQMHFLY